MKSFFNLLVKIVPWFVIAYFWCEVKPAEDYSWLYGIWHGSYFIPNWVISFFQDDRLCRAVEYTSSYGIFWWICAVLTSIYTFFLLLGIVMLIFGIKPNQQK